MAQFPLSNLFDGTKRLFMSIMAQKDDGTDEIMGIDNNGGIKTALVTELPPGTNNIGSVDVNFQSSLISPVGLKVDLQGATISSSSITVGDMQSKTADFVFQNAATSPGLGNLLAVDSFKNLAIEVIGTSVTHQVNFWGLMNSGTKIALTGVNISTLLSATQTTGINEIWQFDITGLENVEIEVVSISDGNLSINGKVVA